MHLQNEGRRRPSYTPSTPAPVGAGAGGGRSAYPTSRTILRALDVVMRLPTEAIADLAERLVDLLDAAGPDSDLELETDACQAEDEVITSGNMALGVGDEDDAEFNGDDEPDDEDRCLADEPLFGMHAYVVERDHLADIRRQLACPIGRKRVPGGAWEPIL